MSERSPSHIVEVPLGDGEDVVRVQVNEVDESLVRVGRGGRSVGRAEETLGQMLGVIRPVANAFVEQCRLMAYPPDEATLQFGMSLSADARILIAGSSVAANFSVGMTWHRRDAQAPPANGPQATQGN
ncbi:CU044_2847 family protein [Embleya sp. NPDC008237]|uniref:CU044_2847 family protein n=1 Tax=Embleya sp. NPDC008237 TaxID=3363978 RepID=UPI0036E78EAB